ncbi:aldo/keto reductase [Actinotalea solisilvae]|uniref:aldo/keto reductase n=1 Tax=Actinotalea solisilvae TaxID=2072922 RepID=UPI0018F24DE9|nr:aldo/keto reductase [Actinotalea solisilvae]
MAAPTTTFRRAGRTGLDLPAVSLGLWQGFGDDRPEERQREIVLHAVERGITHLDLANNYGPPPGAAEAFVGRLLRTALRGRRHELVLTTKAGYRQWPGPYGEHGSRKYLLASLDASLERLGVDHVDVFYSHRFDPRTPLAETLGALATAVASGRARHAGISSYSATRTLEALEVARGLGLTLAVHQPSWSMLNRWVEEPTAPDGRSLLDVVGDAGMGLVAFSPLAQGLLTQKYLDGVPEGSRASRAASFDPAWITPEVRARVRGLDAVARGRGESLARTAIAWVLRDPRTTSVLVGASSVAQLDDSLGALASPPFTAEELAAIDEHAVDSGVNLWGSRSSDL